MPTIRIMDSNGHTTLDVLKEADPNLVREVAPPHHFEVGTEEAMKRFDDLVGHGRGTHFAMRMEGEKGTRITEYSQAGEDTLVWPHLVAG